jgi:trans-aconitate methyltransferase
VNDGDVARRVAALFPSRFLRSYVRWKVSSDPAYAAVFDRVRATSDRILDLGCGAGVLAAYLRARGIEAPIAGIDHDARKIAVARGLGLRDATFDVDDVEDAIELSGTLLLVDVLHYFAEDEQAWLLRTAANKSRLVIIRDAVNDGSWRYRATYAQETFARAVRWLKAERLNFPRRATILDAFEDFECEVVPLWGRTPFNNYLFVFKRVSSGMTKV